MFNFKVYFRVDIDELYSTLKTKEHKPLHFFRTVKKPSFADMSGNLGPPPLFPTFAEI